MIVTYDILYGKLAVNILENGIVTTKSDHLPYFYIATKDENKAIAVLSKFKTEIISVDRTDIRGFLDNEPLTKITVKYPFNVPPIRDELHKFGINTYEADILYNMRYIIDKDLHPSSIENIMYLDIEALQPESGAFPSPKEHEIISISCYSNILKKYVTFAWHPDIKEEVLKKPGQSIYYFTTEKDMVATFIDFWRDIFPEVLLGWNIKFDVEYIIGRLKALGFNPNELSPVGAVKEDEIKGIYNYDLLLEYKDFKNLTFYPSLKYAGEQEGLEKFEVDLRELWSEGKIDEIIKYNLRDVEICKYIDEKYRLLKGSLVFHNLPISEGIPLDHMYFSNIADFILLKKVRKMGYALPTRKKIAKPVIFKGAEVDAKPGLYEKVGVLDFNSMYPSFNIAFNIGPDTKNNSAPREDDIVIDGIRFLNPSVKQSVYSIIIEELLNLRKSYKQRMKRILENEGVETEEYKILDTKQTRIKYFTNAFAYGVTAYRSKGGTAFRLFDVDVSKTITYLGRTLNRKAKEILEERGYEIVLRDTDSLFVLADDVEEVEECRTHINKNLRKYIEEEYGVRNSIIEVGFDKYYSKLYISSKKRYAGYAVWKDGTYLKEPVFDKKGLEMVRKDCPPFVPKYQEKLIRMKLDGRSADEINSYIEDVSKSLPDLPLNKIGIRTHLTKPVEEYKSNSENLSAFQYSKQMAELDLKKGNGNSPFKPFLNIGVGDSFFFTKFRKFGKYPASLRGWVAWHPDKPLPEGFVPDYDYVRKTWVYGIADRVIGKERASKKYVSLDNYI
jgi:DNA polymerase elongation subunit (family B)